MNPCVQDPARRTSYDKPIQQGVPFVVPKNGDKNVADKTVAAAVHTSPSQEGASR